MNENQIPILVACGQFTDRSSDANGVTPVQLMAEACKQAVVDAGSNELLNKVDTIATSGLIADTPGIFTPLAGSYSNLPKTVANLLGIKARNYYCAATGGNTPKC